MATWFPFAYRGFYDVPRTILLVHNGQMYLLDSRFLERSDEYDPRYRIFRLARLDLTLLERPSWDGIETLGELIGYVDVAAVILEFYQAREPRPRLPAGC